MVTSFGESGPSRIFESEVEESQSAASTRTRDDDNGGGGGGGTDSDTDFDRSGNTFGGGRSSGGGGNRSSDGGGGTTDTKTIIAVDPNTGRRTGVEVRADFDEGSATITDGQYISWNRGDEVATVRVSGGVPSGPSTDDPAGLSRRNRANTGGDFVSRDDLTTTQRSRVEAELEQQIERQIGRDVEPERDFTLTQRLTGPGAGRFGVRFTDGFTEQIRIEQQEARENARREAISDFERAVAGGGFVATGGEGQPTGEGPATQRERDAIDEDEVRFTSDLLNIEASVIPGQYADYDVSEDFIQEDLGDEAVDIKLPEGLQFTGPGGEPVGRDFETFLDERAQGVNVFAEQFGAGVEETIPIFGGDIGQTARGGIESLNPFGLASAGIETVETGAFLAGGLPVVGEGDLGERVGTVAGQAAPMAVLASDFAREQPFRLLGGVATGLLGGAAAGRAITGLPNAARAARIRAAGGDIFDVKDIQDPPAQTGGGLPGFTEAAQSDPLFAAEEFLSQGRRSAIGGDRPVAVTGRGAEAVGEFGGFGRLFESPEGASELPGTFFAADVSPLRLPSPETGSGIPRPGIPRPRWRSARFMAEVDPDVQVMPSRAAGAAHAVEVDGNVVRTGLSRAEANRLAEELGGSRVPDPTTSGFQFLSEEADPSGLFIRPRGSITPEQEAIAPPGAMFEATGDIFGIRVGGRSFDIPLTERSISFGGEIVPGRLMQRVGRGPDAPAAGGGELIPGSQVVSETSESLVSAQRVVEDPTEPFAPIGAPSGFGAPLGGVAETAPTAAVSRGQPTDPVFGFETDTTTIFGESFQTEPTLVSDPDASAPPSTQPTGTSTGTATPTGGSSTPFGPISPTLFAPTTPTGPSPTAPPSGPPTLPPTGPPTGPPTSPPTRPPSGPPTPPPSGTPTIPGLPPMTPSGPPGSPFETMPDSPRDRDDERRLTPPPTGQEFENPIASGVEFLFGRQAGTFGTKSPFGDLGGKDSAGDIVSLFGGRQQ